MENINFGALDAAMWLFPFLAVSLGPVNFSASVFSPIKWGYQAACIIYYLNWSIFEKEDILKSLKSCGFFEIFIDWGVVFIFIFWAYL